MACFPHTLFKPQKLSKLIVTNFIRSVLDSGRKAKTQEHLRGRKHKSGKNLSLRPGPHVETGRMPQLATPAVEIRGLK